MKQPILHPRTKLMLDNYLAKPTHGVILSAPSGAGKLYVANWLARELELSAMHIKVMEDKSTISIDQIRNLYQTTRTGNKLAVIIEDAHAMGVDAQNAFLKLLEEPPAGTKFILTVQSEQHLLGTIQSRCQLIEILPPSKKLITQAIPLNNKTESLLLTTNNRLGDFFKKQTDNSSGSQHDELVLAAKQFYSSRTYDRHLYMIGHKFDVDHFSKLLSILAIIIETLLQKDPSRASQKKLLHQAALIEDTSHALLHINGNPKIHLTRLAVRL